MPIDVTQFLQTFIDESTEMLGESENILLNLKLTNINAEDIHKLFRLIHSIKGSSAVFKFNAITEFAHTLENYLDKIRAQTFQLTQNDVDLLLNSIDCIRSIITAIQNNTPIDDTTAKKLNEIFKEKIAGSTQTQLNTATTAEHETKETESVEEKSDGWEIDFNPAINSLQHNNEPLRVFTALKELSHHLEITLDQHELPDFSNMDPKNLYLKWKLKLHANVSKEDLKETFSWITELENITINPLAAHTSEQKHSPSQINPHINTTPATSVRITTEKIDNLINLIGELVITKSILNEIINNFDMSRISKLKEGLAVLENNSRELQDEVMRIRLVPIEFVFNRYSRTVYDLAKKMNKKVELIITGEQTEIDKNMIEKISDPLLHLIRNALDHGIETPEERQRKNKSPIGKIRLNAYQEANNIIIDISDDGNGLNKEKIYAKAINTKQLKETDEITDDKLYQLIFQPGFSTNENVSDISGRGVGLDVVYKNIVDLGGEVKVITSLNEGTTFRLQLPLTLAIMDCQLVKISGQIFSVPLINITEIIRINPVYLKKIDENSLFYQFSDRYIPVVALDKFFKISNEIPIEKKFLIVVEVNNQIAAFVVDEILSQQQIVIKSIEDNYKKIPGISGVTILGDGKVGLIADAKAIINHTLNRNQTTTEDQADTSNLIAETNLELQNYRQDLPFQFLSFVMASQEFGVDIMSVKEIRMWEEATILPNSPSYIKGIINVRGIIIPVLDLGQCLCLGETTYHDNSLIIILMFKTKWRWIYFGLLSEQVSNTYSIQYGEIKPVLDNASNLKKYLQGFVTIGDKMVALLNTNYLGSIVTKQEMPS